MNPSREILFENSPDIRRTFLPGFEGFRDGTINNTFVLAEDNVQHVAESLL